MAHWVLIPLRPLQNQPIYVPMGEEMTIGRQRSCTFYRRDDKALSAKHCCLRVKSDGWQLEVTDRSTNGTFVNGTALRPGKPRPVFDMDILTLTRPPGGSFGEVDDAFTQFRVEQREGVAPPSKRHPEVREDAKTVEVLEQELKRTKKELAAQARRVSLLERQKEKAANWVVENRLLRDSLTKAQDGEAEARGKLQALQQQVQQRKDLERQLEERLEQSEAIAERLKGELLAISQALRDQAAALEDEELLAESAGENPRHFDVSSPVAPPTAMTSDAAGGVQPGSSTRQRLASPFDVCDAVDVPEQAPPAPPLRLPPQPPQPPRLDTGGLPWADGYSEPSAEILFEAAASSALAAPPTPPRPPRRPVARPPPPKRSRIM